MAGDRADVAYPDGNPYHPEQITQAVDADRYPLTARMVGDLFTADPDADFGHGLRIVLAGVDATARPKV
ncbi:hypothetical protein E0H75_12445 [Kribbella capetownensis]|uniref:Tetracycline repressor TetR C-terminal domain-containing protein n=1 Tax=Kribbella capetownensis TaxID=1572659 RepID=A0A4R0JXI4_9ACTN|nr:TetR/AcrR family transcriptional regulator C-terminal domain-containing protein [Kribbella capetownensis]TCC50954.1 hypothetical protein E0H75_12445 [Kribbella capetownensis]